MFASLAIGLYLLGLVLRNQQLVTVAVVLLSFLTYAAFRTTHADVASSGRRLEDNESDEGIQLGGISALRKVSSSRVFEDGEIASCSEYKIGPPWRKSSKSETESLKSCE